MKHASVLLSWIVLLASVAALCAGYANGRTGSFAAPAIAQGRHAAPAAMPLPIDVPDEPQRALFGAHSLDRSADTDDTAGAEVAVERATGWAPPPPAGGLRATTKLALIVYNAGRAAMLDALFVTLPVPVAFAIDTQAEQSAQTAEAAVQSGKPVLAMLPSALAANGDAAALAQWVRRAQALHASGVLGPLDTAVGKTQAALLARLLAQRHWYAIDAVGLDEPALYDAARRVHVPAATRDLVVDTRDDAAYVRFMLRSAGDISRRTGVSIALLRPVPASYRSLQATLPRWAHEGVNVVTPSSLLQ